jgi:hypothetical protein
VRAEADTITRDRLPDIGNANAAYAASERRGRPTDAAPLMKLGRHAEAELAVAQLMEREPAFRLSRQFKGVDCAPQLAAALAAALAGSGIPA